jgi:hypothetical protein
VVYTLILLLLLTVLLSLRLLLTLTLSLLVTLDGEERISLSQVSLAADSSLVAENVQCMTDLAAAGSTGNCYPYQDD